MDAWFEYAVAFSGLIYSMKLQLYEDACTERLASVSTGEITSMDKMLLNRPIRARAADRRDFLDDVEKLKEYVYDSLDEGYTASAEDLEVVRQKALAHHWSGHISDATSPSMTTDEAQHPLLYGELTSLGVRQLHRVFEEHVGGSSAGDTAMLAVDIGSGTGKLLFEWSRLTSESLSDWLGLGVELAPSRMRVARQAFAISNQAVELRHKATTDTCGEAYELVESSTTASASNLPPSLNYSAATRVVLCEEDVLHPSLLTSDTLNLLLRSDSLWSHPEKKPACHACLFCCGLGFDAPFVLEMLRKMEQLLHAMMHENGASSSTVRTCMGMTCVLLLRDMDKMPSLPLFRCTSEAAAEVLGVRGTLEKVVLEATWMTEAPAWVLSFAW